MIPSHNKFKPNILSLNYSAAGAGVSVAGASVAGADRIIVLDDGKIAGFDSHENLIKTNEIYREVYESQTKGGGDFDENGGE